MTILVLAEVMWKQQSEQLGVIGRGEEFPVYWLETSGLILTARVNSRQCTGYSGVNSTDFKLFNTRSTTIDPSIIYG